MGLAELLVGDAANFVHQQALRRAILGALPAQLRSMRHVRIAVKDAAGVAVTAPRRDPVAEGHPPAPAWFTALVAPTVESQDVPVIVEAEASDKSKSSASRATKSPKCGKIWSRSGRVAAVLNIAMIGILYVLFGRVLDPLTVLAAGLSDLERQSYSVRLPQPHARELAVIVDSIQRACSCARDGAFGKSSAQSAADHGAGRRAAAHRARAAR